MYPIKKTSLTHNKIKQDMLNLHPRSRAKVSDHGQLAAPCSSNISIRIKTKSGWCRMHKITILKRGITL